MRQHTSDIIYKGAKGRRQDECKLSEHQRKEIWGKFLNIYIWRLQKKYFKAMPLKLKDMTQWNNLAFDGVFFRKKNRLWDDVWCPKDTTWGHIKLSSLQTSKSNFWVETVAPRTLSTLVFKWNLTDMKLQMKSGLLGKAKRLKEKNKSKPSSVSPPWQGSRPTIRTESTNGHNENLPRLF